MSVQRYRIKGELKPTHLHLIKNDIEVLNCEFVKSTDYDLLKEEFDKLKANDLIFIKASERCGMSMVHYIAEIDKLNQHINKLILSGDRMRDEITFSDDSEWSKRSQKLACARWDDTKENIKNKNINE